MQISELQNWVRAMDRDTQWDLLTAFQLVSHLTEEIGELTQSINRIYGYAGEKEKYQENLRSELVDVFWFLIKIANKFNVDLDAEMLHFSKQVDEWPIEKYRSELIESLKALDDELSAARNELDLKNYPNTDISQD